MLRYLSVAEVAEVIHTNCDIAFTPFMTARRWSFTLNNYADADVQRLGDHELLGGLGVRYLIVGREVASTGTPHLQGYVELTKCVRASYLKKLVVTGGIHCERSGGSAEQNIEYCSKEDPNPITFGSSGGAQGKRSDLDQAADLIKSGGSLRDLCDDRGGLYVKYSRGFERLAHLYAVQRNYPTYFVWRFGFTGTGKSRDTLAESKAVCGESVKWLADKTLTWFDPLTSDCKGCVIDDFDGSCKLPLLLRVLDRYPLSVPIKGGHIEFKCRWVWITSQTSPCSYYSGDLQWKALARRIRDYGIVYEYLADGTIDEKPKEHWDAMI